jgi:large subunit ribosomal protein L13
VKTYATKPSDIKREWYIVDAEGQNLGRLATRIATVLKGKHKVIYSPSMDTGDYVVVVNAEKVAVTGRKMDEKMYYHHTGFPGGLRQINLSDQLATHPDRVLKAAVKGMLPHNRLGRAMRYTRAPSTRTQRTSPRSWNCRLERKNGRPTIL